MDSREVLGGEMTFIDVVFECAREPGFVRQFDRLTGSNLSMKGSGLELMIDGATGRQDANCAKFLEFVHETVWTRIEVTP